MAQRERRLVSEYLSQTYPNAEIREQVYLGTHTPGINVADLSQGEIRYLGRWRRYADAVVILPDKLVLVEGSMTSKAGYISQLEMYARLLPSTPELQPFVNLPLEIVYVVALEDPLVSQMAREHGINPVIFRPDWVNEFISGLPQNDQRGRFAPKIQPLGK